MIKLRPVLAADADALFPLIFRTRVAYTILWDGPESLAAYREALAKREEQTRKGEIFLFTIVETASGRPIGTASVRPGEHKGRGDVGLWIGEAFQGKGYGTCAVRQLIRHGFDLLGLEKIEGFVFVGNIASRRAFEKNGFLLEGTLRKAAWKRGKLVDEWIFGITREDDAARG